MDWTASPSTLLRAKGVLDNALCARNWKRKGIVAKGLGRERIGECKGPNVRGVYGQKGGGEICQSRQGKGLRDMYAAFANNPSTFVNNGFHFHSLPNSVPTELQLLPLLFIR
ncbi:hypothetical protein PanWU01x14_355450 [Parasponia andersonii]|uniref:Uncharacterized protein n=1 Tax=Parasponia andersonii TaxID=3476 RepID=A0A2P5A977_PARAD|nr:hypothetical protein PanWU01x14_355450 [Parasponia andersonii]